MPKNITIQRILGVLLHRIRFIVIVALAAGLLTFLYTNFFITPQYTSSTMIFVQNYNKKDTSSDSSANKSDADASKNSNSSSNESNNEVAQKIFNSDISGSSTLAKICVTLFQNSDKITALYSGCHVGFATVDGTFYITVNVSGSDPEKCANVANQIADMCNEVFHDNFMYGQLGIIRTAKAPSAPISPDKMKNTLIGFAVGLVAACLISILLELIDTTIKSDEDLSEIYKIPVFAEIPDFNTGGK